MVQKAIPPMKQCSMEIPDSRKSSGATTTRSTLEKEPNCMARMYLLVTETIMLVLETIGRPRLLMVAKAMTPSICQLTAAVK
jgi:hypothetical protein